MFPNQSGRKKPSEETTLAMVREHRVIQNARTSTLVVNLALGGQPECRSILKLCDSTVEGKLLERSRRRLVLPLRSRDTLDYISQAPSRDNKPSKVLPKLQKETVTSSLTSPGSIIDDELKLVGSTNMVRIPDRRYVWRCHRPDRGVV